MERTSDAEPALDEVVGRALLTSLVEETKAGVANALAGLGGVGAVLAADIDAAAGG